MEYQKENFNGTYDFRSHFHNGYTVGSHIHEYSEILYCLKGGGDVWINGKNVHLQDEEFVFIPPNYIHQYRFIDVTVICAVFSNDFIPLFFKLTKGRKLTAGKFKSNELKNIFESLPQISKDSSVLIMAYLNLICNKVIEQGTFEESTMSDAILYQKVISYMSENFNQDIHLEKIANIFGYNKKYLSGALHSLTGMHFTDFAAMYRVKYAKNLLTHNPELSVTEISEKCGFASINTFNRKFKKMTSVTPTQYRKLYALTEK